MKNITLKIDGVAALYADVGTIATRSDTYRDRWMPKDETYLTDLKVRQNGTYEAEQMGFYGFSKIVVDISEDRPNEVVGADPETGDIYAVSVDGEGIITRTLIGRADG